MLHLFHFSWSQNILDTWKLNLMALLTTAVLKKGLYIKSGHLCHINLHARKRIYLQISAGIQDKSLRSLFSWLFIKISDYINKTTQYHHRKKNSSFTKWSKNHFCLCVVWGMFYLFVFHSFLVVYNAKLGEGLYVS